MGEIADAILDGVFCQECGEYLGEGDGYPVTCAGCSGRQRPHRTPKRRDSTGPSVPMGSGTKLWRCLEAVAAAKDGRRWEDAPKQHNRLFGRGLIRKVDGKAVLSDRGTAALKEGYVW